jgi:hypothetical protein
MKISNTIILCCALINYSALNTMDIIEIDGTTRPNSIQEIFLQLPAITQTEITQLSKPSCLSVITEEDFRFINEEELEKIKNYSQDIKNHYFTDRSFFLTDETTIKKSTKDCLGVTLLGALPLSTALGLLTALVVPIHDNPSNHNFGTNLKIGMALGTSLLFFVSCTALSIIFAIRRGLQKFH